MDDPILKLLPTEQPLAFRRLSHPERLWRARLWAMIWTLTKDEAYSWFGALTSNAEFEERMRLVISATDDEILVDALASTPPAT